MGQGCVTRVDLSIFRVAKDCVESMEAASGRESRFLCSL